jgi:hypothetical protein
MQPIKDRLMAMLSRIADELEMRNKPRKAPDIYKIARDCVEITSNQDFVTYNHDIGLYQNCRECAQLNTKVARKERTRAQMLAYYNVPPDQREVILRLDMDNVLCPIRNNEYVDLYGPNQASPEEIRSAATPYDVLRQTYDEKSKDLNLLASLIEKERGRKK